MFRALRIQEADAIREDGRLPLTVVVQERKPRRFGVGGSYSTLDGAGSRPTGCTATFSGRRERLRFDATVASIGNVDSLRSRRAYLPARRDVHQARRLHAGYGLRRIALRRSRSAGSLYAHRHHRPARLQPALLGRTLGTRVPQRRICPIRGRHFGTRYFTTVSTLGGLTFDNRDNHDRRYGRLLCRGARGTLLRIQLRQCRRSHHCGRPDLSRFRRGRSRRPAGRVKIGSIVGAPISTRPRRTSCFFAGGGGSVRGYAYRSIGVVTPAGQVIGGRSLIEGSAELRVRVTTPSASSRLPTPAMSGPNSFPSSRKMRGGRGRRAALLTGLGPIRLDAALPLEPLPGRPDRRLSTLE